MIAIPRHSLFINDLFKDSYNVPATLLVQPERETTKQVVTMQYCKRQREEDSERRETATRARGWWWSDQESSPEEAMFGLRSARWVAVRLEKKGDKCALGRWYIVHGIDWRRERQREGNDLPVWGTEWSQYVEWQVRNNRRWEWKIKQVLDHKESCESHHGGWTWFRGAWEPPKQVKQADACCGKASVISSPRHVKNTYV